MGAVLPRALFCLTALFVALVPGCSPRGDANALRTQTITLPSGEQIRAEVLTDPRDMASGMMFREQLPPDRGLLFVHTSPGRYPYWMHNVSVPLDIIWLDSSRTIVEISANTPPCMKPAAQCPNYGGNYQAMFVLELAGGMAEKYGLRPGVTLRF
jgi:uncharacterized protein